jgi:hypothetical protein
MTNSLTANVVQYTCNPRKDDGSGVLVVRQPNRKKNSETNIAFLVNYQAIPLCRNLRSNDYVQVTYKLISYMRHNSDGEQYWITNCYVKDLVKLDDKK